MHRQAGFTLIELLVVVAIISLLLAVGMLALQPSQATRLQQNLAQARIWLQSSCDQAAFSGLPVAIVPDERALEALILKADRWVPLEKPFMRSEGVRWRWESARRIPQDFAPLSDEAWLCWPEGEMTPGALMAEADTVAYRLRWDAWGRFTLETVR